LSHPYHYGGKVYSFRDFTLLFGEDGIKSDPHIGPIESDTDDCKWTHFRAPDGFIYELTYSTAHPSIAE